MYQPRSQPPASFPFDLTSAEEERARRLHRDSIVFDFLSQHVGGAHIYAAYPDELKADLQHSLRTAGPGWRPILTAAYWPYQVALRGASSMVHDWYVASGLTCGTYSVPVYDQRNDDADWFDALVAAPAGLPWFRYVTTAKEIRRAKAENAVSFFGHWQPVRPIPADLIAVDDAYRRGLRSLMLTYNRADQVGAGCTAPEDTGLTPFGRDLVKHCNEIGLIVDTSHCGLRTTLDACKVSSKPVTANHTCARAVTDVARGKSDDVLKAVADTGGVIGIVTVPFFISRDRNPTIEAMLDHVDYVANLVGWQHVAIGTDYPLQAPIEIALLLTGPALNADLGFRAEDNLDPRDRTIGFEDYRDLPNITRGLVKRGYSDEQIAGILGENALRVFESVCG